MFSFLAVLLSCMYVLTPLASAQELEEPELEISSLFTGFMDEVYQNLDGLTVLDANGLDVTENFINKANEYYMVRDYKSIQDMIKNQDLSVSLEQREVENPGEIGLFAGDIKGENVSRQFYHLATDTKKKFTKEWLTTLNGSFSYNINTHKITSVSGPRITLTTANFGALWSPALESVLTNNYISGGTTANYSANYTMRATLGISVGDLPLGFNYNFGNHTDSFSARPYSN